MVSVHLDRHGRGYLRHEGVVREVLNLSLTKAKVIPQGSTFGYLLVVFFMSFLDTFDSILTGIAVSH